VGEKGTGSYRTRASSVNARVLLSLLLAFVVPPVVWRVSLLVMFHPVVAGALGPHPSLNATLKLCALLLSVCAGFSFVVRIWPYRSLEPSERAFLIAAAFVYIPVFCLGLLIWGVALAGGI